MKYIERKNGITLISLVVTIVVLLILAGISISMLTDNNGLLNQAAKAKEKSQQAEKNELDNIENYINNYVSGLNDDRLGNEEILITNANQIYALGRILMTDSARNGMIPNYTTNGGLQADLNVFNFPEGITTDQEKISYLMTTSYKLENNIEIKCQKNGTESFLGIGGEERPFKGFFNGNGKTITLSETTLTLNAYGPVNIGSVFGEVDEGTIANLKVELGGDITINQGITRINFGVVIGKMSNSQLYNVHVNMNEKQVQCLFDTANYRPYTDIGGLVANIYGSSMVSNCSLNLTNNSKIFVTDTNDTDPYEFYIGGIVARIIKEGNKRTTISNCNVNLTNSNISMITPNLGMCAGVVACADQTTISNTKVTFIESTMGVNSSGESYNTGNEYFSVVTGGIIGFARAGSDNSSATIGNEGITIDNCSFVSTNTTQKEILYAKEISGGTPNVGGIAGLAFNNCSIKNSNVNVTNGIMIAQRTVEDDYNVFGSTCGGIIGRLEHTGLIKNCVVNGNNLNILAKSTKDEVYSGGIVGIDMGSYHKNQISLDNNKFLGNGTSNITVELVRGDKENSKICVGGIAGESAYIMKNCSVSGTNIYHKGANTGVTNAGIGKLAGRFGITKGLWSTNAYFTPDTTKGILGCTTNNVTISVDDNNSGVVATGEEYGIAN